MAYSKLHSSVVNSSLWEEPDHVRLLFITLLALCDKHGCVYGSRPGLERAANIAWYTDSDSDIDPWEVLLGPDTTSSDKMRAPENEGRRIEEIPGGFRLLNFEYYRGLRNEDDRREQNRIAQERFRNKSKQSKPPSATVSHDKPLKAHTEAEADTEGYVGALPRKRSFVKPSLEELKFAVLKAGLPEAEAQNFLNYYEARGWMMGKSPMRSWPHAVGNWKKNYEQRRYENTTTTHLKGFNRNTGTANDNPAVHSQYAGIGRRDAVQPPPPSPTVPPPPT